MALFFFLLHLYYELFFPFNRCDNECMSVADDLLEAVKVVTEKPLSAPSTLKNLEDNWKEYHLAQEMIQDCNDVVGAFFPFDIRACL